MLNTGKFTDNYDIEKRLGEGGYGVVFQCNHKATGQKRAVKLISKAEATEETREEFIKETDMLKRLAHPNIITIFEMFEDNA